MQKIIAIIFVKENGLGKILIGEDLKKYQVLHNQAVAAYKKAYPMVETIKGPLVKVKIATIKNQILTENDIRSPLNRILIMRQDCHIILLQKIAFNTYWNIHTKGLELLNKKHEGIKGVFVRVKIL